MKVIETLSAILKKHNIKGVQLSEVVEVKMAMEGVLADGTVVATPNESFEVGAELYVIDAEGNPQPAPDGEHTLDNGMVLVSVGGFITEVTEVEPSEEEMSADIAATIAAMDEQLTSIKNQLAENEKFEGKGVGAAGTRARGALGDLGKLSKARRAEIQEKKNAAKAAK